MPDTDTKINYVGTGLFGKLDPGWNITESQGVSNNSQYYSASSGLEKYIVLLAFLWRKLSSFNT